jgi:CheY-like chemotaxis protein
VAPPEPKVAWAIDVMDRQAKHLAGLVDDLLDVARISQGKIALNRERVDLNAVVAHSVETSQPLFEARRQTLAVERSGTPVWLHGDFSRLSQVVSNLLHNAAKYSEEGSRVELRLAAADGAARIVVRDHGIGIDPALMPHIFELFSQGQQSLDRSQGGLGVGLTLVRRLVELHGGRIVATSGGVGKGSEFEVIIPCMSVVGDEPDAGAAPSPSAAPAGGSRILIVDDNLDAAESIALFLQLEGHEVKSARDVMTALASVPVFAPQVVLLDIGLPVLDGYEVARRMRKMPATRDALIVAVSGYGQPEDKQRSKEAGFDHHFVKPTDPQELVDLIARWQRDAGAARRNTAG